MLSMWRGFCFLSWNIRSALKGQEYYREKEKDDHLPGDDGR
jgi:hypothetical protein